MTRGSISNSKHCGDVAHSLIFCWGDEVGRNDIHKTLGDTSPPPLTPCVYSTDSVNNLKIEYILVFVFANTFVSIFVLQTTMYFVNDSFHFR
jgi:hypothetical protein